MGPVVEPILADVIAALEAEGATVVDGTDIDLSATADEFPALLCEFKTDIATYLETYVDGTNPVTGEAYPQTLAELIEFNQAHPELEGPWNDLGLRARRGDERSRRRLAPTSAQARRRPSRTRSTSSWPTNDLDAIIALTNGPAWPTNDDPDEGDLDGHFEYFVGSSSAAAVSGYADITVPAGYASQRTAGSGSPSSAAAGPNRSCSALPTTTSRRRTFVSRRSSSRRSATICSPASQTRRRRRSGSRRPRVSAISSCASGRDCRGDNEARPFGRASCCSALARRGRPDQERRAVDVRTRGSADTKRTDTPTTRRQTYPGAIGSTSSRPRSSWSCTSRRSRSAPASRGSRSSVSSSLLGTAFLLFAVAELTYMTYHLDWTVFLFAHTIAEVFDLAAFVLVFAAAAWHAAVARRPVLEAGR